MFRILALLLLLPASAALSHEVWIDPEAYQVEKGDTIEAALKNGQNFAGVDLAFFPARTARFDVIVGGKPSAIKGRPGDLPAITGLKTPQGLTVLVYQSRPDTLTYPEWDKFQTFVQHKDLGDVRARHLARGLPPSPVKELYTRFSKTLVAVGHGKGRDAPTGLETEIVALANPYRDDISGGLPVRVLYRAVPRANAQVELFERAPDGTVTISLHRTDRDGRALLPVHPGHSYLVDAVILRQPAPELAAKYKVQWESLWAALTFAVPG
ncbi:DUF4198 domain-containing protein [Thalassovita sp.]|uniref:DUF4198 domain-containing protein n=1 Tax=Thalassovita sp. TaxID=1979401 RepID=UPI0039B6F2D8